MHLPTTVCLSISEKPRSTNRGLGVQGLGFRGLGFYVGV